MVDSIDEIKKERDQLKAALSSMSEGLIVIGKDRKINLMNQSAGVLLRISESEAMGKTIENVFRLFKRQGDEDEEQTAVLLKNLLNKPNIINIKLGDDFYCKLETGASFPVSAIMTSLYNKSHGGGAIILFRDITREKRADRAKSEFVSLASHQLQTPLASINWYTEMLLGGQAGKLENKQKKYLEQIYRSSKRMVELVNSLLNISRIELGYLAIEPEPADLKEILESVLIELSSQIKAKKLKIEKQIDEDLPTLNLDMRLARVVFQNLVSNAVKYNKDGGVVGVVIKNKGSSILISVSDEGCGIPKEQQFMIFSKLFRADNAREKAPDGNGLGLYIVRSVLEQAGCKIWFESKGENQGVIFFVSVPASGMIKKEGTKKLT